ncbi:MAG: cell division protein ZapA, partial [bacterium]|nr:cell division protein ZapA [bacterium]
MSEGKHYIEVCIDGKIYTLGGQEEETYIQRVASYLNEKIATMKAQTGFQRMSQEWQTLMLQLNVADDYFKSHEKLKQLELEKGDWERERYSLKHELVNIQMKLEKANQEYSNMRNACSQAQKELYRERESKSQMEAKTATAEVELARLQKQNEGLEAAQKQAEQELSAQQEERQKQTKELEGQIEELKQQI